MYFQLLGFRNTLFLSYCHFFRMYLQSYEFSVLQNYHRNLLYKCIELYFNTKKQQQSPSTALYFVASCCFSAVFSVVITYHYSSYLSQSATEPLKSRRQSQQRSLNTEVALFAFDSQQWRWLLVVVVHLICSQSHMHCKMLSLAFSRYRDCHILIEKGSGSFTLV